MIQLPLWLFVLLCLLAAFALLQHLFLPGVRWYFRRRMGRLLEHLNQHLAIELSRFTFLRRQTLIDNLLFDPAVQAAAKAWALERQESEQEAMERVLSYVKEIVPAFNAYFYFRIGSFLARRLATKLFRVRLGQMDAKALKELPKDAGIIFVLNHRSNLDYVLVSHFMSDKAAISYAVGEWARVWPLQSLVRAMGAYFVRRKDSNSLYRKVLERYVQIATREGVTQAIFLEGRLTRDGRLGEAKLGLLDYILRDFDPKTSRPLYFIPVGINYDRTLEDRSLLRSKEAESQNASGTPFWQVFRFVFKQIGRWLTGRWHRFGYACVNFGTPLSLQEMVARRKLDLKAMDKEERIHQTHQIAQELMAAIGQIIPVLPVCLVSRYFTQRPTEPCSQIELKTQLYEWVQTLEEKGVQPYVPRKDLDYAIEVGLRMLLLRRIISIVDQQYQVVLDEIPILEYYANSIAHYFDLPNDRAESLE